jgi:hypothetical protein
VSEPRSPIEEQVAEIEHADGAGVLEVSNELVDKYGGPGPLETEAPLLVRLLVALLQRRPDLCQTPLRDLLDGLAVTGHTIDEYTVPSVCEEIRNEVSRSLDFWRNRLWTPGEDDDSRSEALRVLSYYDPQAQGIRNGAMSTVQTISPRAEGWYAAFDAARRILSGTAEWPRLLHVLVGRMETDSFATKTNPPYPRPEVAILVSFLPYQESRAWIYDRLSKWHPLEGMEEIQYLPTNIQIEILSRIVTRLNEEDLWVDTGGLYPIYLLLRAVIFRSPAIGEYTAQAGSVIYRPDAKPPERARLTMESVTALEPILKCRRLWEIDTNLLSVFGLPNKQDELATWITAAKKSPA